MTTSSRLKRDARLEEREAILERLRARFAQIPSDISLTDELIADRREEAKREAREA